MLTFELHFLDSVKTICDECEGKRYHANVLELKFQNTNIAEVLDMTVNQAYEFFNSSRINKHLQLLQEVGLGNLKYADWIIDMGPEGGKKGGELIFQGLPEDIINCNHSITGKYLKRMI